MSERGCIKCGSTDAEQNHVSMTGSGLSNILDVQNHQFTLVYCKNCGYSEFYNKEASEEGNVFDYFFGN